MKKALIILLFLSLGVNVYLHSYLILSLEQNNYWLNFVLTVGLLMLDIVVIIVSNSKKIYICNIIITIAFEILLLSYLPNILLFTHLGVFIPIVTATMSAGFVFIALIISIIIPLRRKKKDTMKS